MLFRSVLFKLYYKDGNVECPGDGVRYRIIAKSNGALMMSGETNAVGETQGFDFRGEKETFKILVYSPQDSAAWVEPKTDSRYDDDDTSIEVKREGKLGVRVLRVRVMPYLKVRFIDNADRKPIANAQFTAYAIDDNGKEAVARDLKSEKPIRGKTDNNGYTDVIYCTRKLMFKFVLPRTNVTVSSDRFSPMLQGQGVDALDVPFKTSIAITESVPQTIANLAGIVHVPIIISPQDQELLMIPQKIGRAHV